MSNFAFSNHEVLMPFECMHFNLTILKMSSNIMYDIIQESLVACTDQS